MELSLSVRDVRKFKETKKHFDRVREDMEIAQVKNAQAPRNKPHEVEEATSSLSITRKCFRHLALDYVLQVSEMTSSSLKPQTHQAGIPTEQSRSCCGINCAANKYLNIEFDPIRQV